MNDIGYTPQSFSGSVSESSIKGIQAEPEKLERVRGYSEMAIAFHKEDANPNQQLFFQEQLALITKLLRNHHL